MQKSAVAVSPSARKTKRYRVSPKDSHHPYIVGGTMRIHTKAHSLHRVWRLVSDRDKPEPMCNIFIIQYCRVLMKFHQINRQRWNLRDHNSSQGVCYAGVRFAQNKLDLMGCHVQNFDFWEALVRHLGIFCGR